MEIPPRSALLARLRALPAAGPLLARLDGNPVAYVVGGAVRDMLLGGEPDELDLVVEGDAAAFARSLGPARVHDRFGTSTVTLEGFTYDIARARTESYARPGALPEVRPARLADDLRRRDFTVNTLATALNGPSAGELRSVPDALKDLDARLLRVLHRRSFIDDPTRLFRLVRYASRLGFTIEGETLELARTAIGSGAIATVTGPRIGNELRLLAREPDPVAALLKLHDLGIDRELDAEFGLSEPQLARDALALLPHDGRPDLVVLGIAGRGVAPGALRALLDRLAFPAEDRDVVVALAGDEPVALARRLERAATPSQILEAVDRAGPELVATAGALGPADIARRWLEELRTVRLEISGDDVLAAGVAPGPAVGTALRAALAAKLDGRALTRDEELEHALQAARSGR